MPPARSRGARTDLGSAAAKENLIGGVVVSPDGARVYALGVDAAGQAADQPASVAVFATQDGSVRLLAGQLGGSTLSFISPVFARD